MQTIDLSLFHKIREPKIPSDKAPLLIMLHGYGSNEEDLFSFAEELPGEFFIISARAPFPLQPYGHAWYAIHFDNMNGKFTDEVQAIASREKIADFIDEVVASYPVDGKDVTLVGFSQGCILSFAVALSYPEKVKNIVGLSGFIDRDILKEGYEKKDFSHLSVYSSHGTVDQVIPVDWARKTRPLLDELGIANSFSEFPVGHGVAPQNFTEIQKFLQKKV
ncbi:phospholipase [Salinimicrobium marinum]|uniref:Phospholipase n=1 Tax=Salinimicrobium marinum TaxID=680283 RepID=A0A918S990_9FLAO|nr:alpha/beta fold hydrolase [Salinimicrobium marinum]GHA31339.1 phospholipase [Salinimicrobium marinum]